MMPSKKVCVIGLGYIGLPTAAVIADHGIKVLGVDVARETVDATNAGKTKIVERELEPLVKKVVASGYLSAALKPEAADVFVIAVPTPFVEGHKPDMSFVEAAAHSIAPVIEHGNLVILESTSPVGSTEFIAELLMRARPDLGNFKGNDPARGVHVAYCPERVLPGNILQEIVENDRVIGGITPLATNLAADFYKLFVKGKCLRTEARTAELCKLAENSFRDVNIAFANELSIIAERLGVNPWNLIELANHHPRVKILQPGPGVGGHCIAVDPWFIVHSSPKEAQLIQTARKVNDSKPDWVVAQVKREVAAMHFDDQSTKPTIACFGLAFKPNIDDLRESPSVKVTESLANSKIGNIIAIEPNVTTLPYRLATQGVSLCSIDEALKQADILVFLVDHKEFQSIEPAAGVAVVDACGLVERRRRKSI